MTATGWSATRHPCLCARVVKSRAFLQLALRRRGIRSVGIPVQQSFNPSSSKISLRTNWEKASPMRRVTSDRLRPRSDGVVAPSACRVASLRSTAHRLTAAMACSKANDDIIRVSQAAKMREQVAVGHCLLATMRRIRGCGEATGSSRSRAFCCHRSLIPVFSQVTAFVAEAHSTSVEDVICTPVRESPMTTLSTISPRTAA